MVGRCNQERLAAQQRLIGYRHISRIVVLKWLPNSGQACNPDFTLRGNNGSTRSEIVAREAVVRVITINYSLASRKVDQNPVRLVVSVYHPA